MNLFTTAQLVGKTNSSLYYDTRTNQVKFSPVPVLTMSGNNAFDITVCGNKGETSKKKELKKQELDKKHKQKNTKTSTTELPQTEPKPKRTRKEVAFTDEMRCCANTSDGSRCALKRFEPSGELCYVHYQKTLPKPEPPKPVVEEKIKKWYHLW